MRQNINRKVDIIIPVYNAFDDLKKCVESLKSHTDLSIHRIIFINDCSSDEKILPYLHEQSDKNIILINNETNKGFSANVNIGIEYSNQDVILLNTDTIVTHQWIEKLSRCAYRQESIATVTPLSNNATLCSVPLFCEENEIPEGVSVDEYAREIERISLKRYPIIPVAVGFCMYIKRKVIEEVGLFDAKTFGRGYGEENDFCNRAIQLGFCHVMCDDTFVYHKGSESFLEKEKKEYMLQNDKILRKRYPYIMKEVLDVYLRQMPNWEINANAKLFTKVSFSNKKKNILYLLMSDFREDTRDHIGGTQFHVKDLVSGLKEDYNIFVAARDGNYLRVTAYIDNSHVSLQFYIGEAPKYNLFRDERQREIYQNLLLAFQIDLVHIQHTRGLSLDLFYLAKDNGIPLLFTVNDFYYICPILKAIDLRGQSCIDSDRKEPCGECLEKEKSIYANLSYIAKWRREHEKVLELCNMVIAPSKSAAHILTKYYPAIQDKMRILPHGTDMKLVEENNIGMDREEKKSLKVAFIGGINDIKGGKIISEMIKEDSPHMDWHIFGGIGYPDLQHLEKNNLAKTGWYIRDELSSLLKKNRIDIVCILSLVPETFCYTLSEALLCKIPVIVTDVGALGERVNQMECGWIVPKESMAQDILKLLENIRTSPQEYMEKYRKVQMLKVKSVQDMCLEYQKLYNEIIKETRLKQEFNSEIILEGYINGNPAQYQGMARNADTFADLQKAQLELTELKRTLSYQIINKMREIRFPLKKQIKRMVIKIKK